MPRLRIGIYGAGGHGREVAPLFPRQTETAPEVVFIEDDPEKVGRTVNGISVKSFTDLCRENDRSRLLVISVADPYARSRIAKKCRQNGFAFTTIAADNALIHPGNVIGEGGIFSPFTLITTNITIGAHFHCNMYSFAAHDCVIGDYVTFGPRVSCNGRVRIEDFVFVGAGAVLRQGVPEKPLLIGHGSVIGMGSVVTKDVPPGVLVMGNPARHVRDLPPPPK